MDAQRRRAGQVGIAEDVRVAPDQLVTDGADHPREGEGALLLGHAGVEDDLQQQVPQFIAQFLQKTGLDRLRDLVGLFQGIGQDGLEGLGQISSAAARWIAQARH